MRNIKFIVFLIALGLLFAAGATDAGAAAVIKTKGGKLAIAYETQFYMQNRDDGSGPDGTDTTTDMFFRRNRVILTGTLMKDVDFYYSIEHQGDRRIGDTEVMNSNIDRFTVLDSYIRFNVSDSLKVNVGLQKDPLVREHNTGCFFPLSLDRSLFVYTSIPRRSRDFGVMLWGNAISDHLQYKVSLMEGIDNPSAPASSLRLTGRVHYSVFDPESLPLYFGTYLGKKKVLTMGLGFQTEGSAVYGNMAGKGDENGYSAMTYDVFFEYPMDAGTVTAEGAYLSSDFGDNYKGVDPDPISMGIDGEKNGSFAKLGYLFPGKKFQLFFRTENWNFANLGGIDGQSIAWTAFGGNYYIKGNDLRVTIEYSTNDFDKEDAENQDFGTLTTMLQLRF